MAVKGANLRYNIRVPRLTDQRLQWLWRILRLLHLAVLPLIPELRQTSLSSDSVDPSPSVSLPACSSAIRRSRITLARVATPGPYSAGSYTHLCKSLKTLGMQREPHFNDFSNLRHLCIKVSALGLSCCWKQSAPGRG